ncbi:MAG: hypothetical protein AAFO99_02490 [Bacteroidota bacterium]
MNQPFNFKRIGLSIYRDVVLLRNTIVTALLVSGGLLFIGFLFSLWGDRLVTASEFGSLFGKIYVPLGLLFVFSIFKEAHDKKANHFYFALPLSPLERLTATWFATSVLYTLFFTLFAFFVGQLAILLASLLSKTSFHGLSIFSESYGQSVKFYMLVQPLFLLGAIGFTKNRIGKTLLLLLLAFFSFFIYNGILFSMFNMGYDMFSGDSSVSAAFDSTSADFEIIGKWFWFIILGPVMLIAAYFKLIEKEVY